LCSSDETLDVSVLNEWFDCVFCINRDDRPERWNVVEARFAAAGLAVERFSAITPRPGPQATILPGTAEERWQAAVTACAASHVAAVREADRRGARGVFLFQDDVAFHPQFESTLRLWMAELPPDWDMLYLGGWHPEVAKGADGHFFAVPRPEPVREHVYRLRHDFCLHACGIRQSLFADVLAIDFHTGEPMDCAIIRVFQQRRNCYGLMTAEESRPGAWGLVQQDHSLGTDLRDPSELERFRWPGW
jgi:hypothetical protein